MGLCLSILRKRKTQIWKVRFVFFEPRRRQIPFCSKTTKVLHMPPQRKSMLGREALNFFFVSILVGLVEGQGDFIWNSTYADLLPSCNIAGRKYCKFHPRYQVGNSLFSYKLARRFFYMEHRRSLFIA